LSLYSKQATTPGRGMTVEVPGLTSVPITHGTTEEVLTIFDAGMANRAIGCTNLNEHSSRSHCVFTVDVEGQTLLHHVPFQCENLDKFFSFFIYFIFFSFDIDKFFVIFRAGLNLTTGLKAHGKLHLVDLAGSERVKQVNQDPSTPG
jgi:hypothetical protein